MILAEGELGRRWFEEVWNKGRREAISEMLSPSTVLHDADRETIGLEGFVAFFDRMRGALSNIQITVHDLFAENDRVCVRWSCTATHTGPELGLAATAKSVTV